jgi:predicted HTH transcriptional regulator
VNVADLLTRPEGKSLECKRNLTSAEPVLRTIVAFANTAGGTLIFGVEDERRTVVGVGDPLRLEERLVNLVTDSIRPRLAPDVEVVPWRKTHLVVVRIYPGAGRSYHLKVLGPQEGVFVRVGSSNRRADPLLLEELRRASRHEAFDEQPVVGPSSEALDFRAASELFAPSRRLTRNDLRVLGLLVPHQGHLRPSVGRNNGSVIAV